MEKILLTVDGQSAGTRLDAYLAGALPDRSRTAVQRLCDEGLTLVDGVPAGKKLLLKPGQTVEVSLPPPKELDAKPENIPLDIVYEDEDLIVVNKPKGLVVHPAPGNESGTLVNALLFHCGDGLSGIGGAARPGIVHRIDKDTSGLLVAAKSDHAHQGLTAQLAARTAVRRYHAVVHGRLRSDSGRIDAPIGRHPIDRKRMCVALAGKNGRPAATRYTVVEELDGFTHVMCELETGRTHQIRVHMAHIGHPVAGDPVYGPRSALLTKAAASLTGQCLHARTLGFVHPRTGEYREFTSELPGYFTAFLDARHIR